LLLYCLHSFRFRPQFWLRPQKATHNLGY
jgi:hypothetical protein